MKVEFCGTAIGAPACGWTATVAFRGMSQPGFGMTIGDALDDAFRNWSARMASSDCQLDAETEAESATRTEAGA